MMTKRLFLKCLLTQSQKFFSQVELEWRLDQTNWKKKTIYDEKQRAAITEQRQYDLLSNVVSNSWST